jgi:hypothetical protein
MAHTYTEAVTVNPRTAIKAPVAPERKYQEQQNTRQSFIVD